MFKLIHGLDPKLVDTEVKKHLTNYQKNEINIIKNLDDLNDLYFLSIQSSLFNEPKIHIFYNDKIFSSLEEFKNNEKILTIILEKEINLIFISYTKISTASKISNFLKNIDVIEIKQLNNRNKLIYIESILEKNNLLYDEEILNVLDLKLPNDAQIINNEISKLLLYPHLNLEIVNNLICDYQQANVFDLLKYGFDNDLNKLMKTYESITSSNQDINYLIQILSLQLANLLIFYNLKSLNYSYQQISTYLGLTYYTYKINEELVKKRNKKEIENIINNLYELDIKIKSNLIDKTISFKHFLLKLIR